MQTCIQGVARTPLAAILRSDLMLRAILANYAMPACLQQNLKSGGYIGYIGGYIGAKEAWQSQHLPT
jgi:hypothetical protein